MYKREIVWLIVRLIGVYFAYCALVSFFSLASAASAVYSASPGDTNSNSTTTIVAPGIPAMQTNPNAPAKPADPATEKAQSDAVKSLLLYIFLTGLYGAAAFYLLKRGDFLFHILNSENLPGAGRKEKDPTVTSLRL